MTPFDADGHLTDFAAQALADGQIDLLPPDATGHCEACAACAKRVGEMALSSLATTEAFRVGRPAKHRFPIVFALVAAAIAIVGSVPTLTELPGRAFNALAALPLVPGLFHSLAELGVGSAAALTLTSCLLVLIGAAVAVRASRRHKEIAS